MMERRDTATGTLLGTSLSVAGNIQGETDVTVEGRLEGTLELRATLTVGPEAVVKADLFVHRAVVQGVVVGNIHASEAVELLAGCRVVGNIITPSLLIEDGARVKGDVDMSPDAVAGRRMHRAPPTVGVYPTSRAQHAPPAPRRWGSTAVTPMPTPMKPPLARPFSPAPRSNPPPLRDPLPPKGRALEGAAVTIPETGVETQPPTRPPTTPPEARPLPSRGSRQRVTIRRR